MSYLAILIIYLFLLQFVVGEEKCEDRKYLLTIANEKRVYELDLITKNSRQIFERTSATRTLTSIAVDDTDSISVAFVAEESTRGYIHKLKFMQGFQVSRELIVDNSEYRCNSLAVQKDNRYLFCADKYKNIIATYSFNGSMVNSDSVSTIEKIASSNQYPYLLTNYVYASSFNSFMYENLLSQTGASISDIYATKDDSIYWAKLAGTSWLYRKTDLIRGLKNRYAKEVTSIAIDGTTLYYADAGPSELYECPDFEQRDNCVVIGDCLVTDMVPVSHACSYFGSVHVYQSNHTLFSNHTVYSNHTLYSNRTFNHVYEPDNNNLFVFHILGIGLLILVVSLLVVVLVALSCRPTNKEPRKSQSVRLEEPRSKLSMPMETVETVVDPWTTDLALYS